MKTGSRYINGLLALSVLVNISALFVTIIGPDGALYASVAKTMVQRDNYIELFAEGHDWLDKPHFPFWITALSFKFFGFTNWAYKLPAVLFLLMGGQYTYLFARKLYGKEVAVWAVLLLLTAQHIILSNNDVRAEPYLTGLIIASLYHFYRTLVQKNWLHLVLGALFAGCAVMTKGMFALIPVIGAIGGHLVIHREWKALFHKQWLWAGGLILLFITPELFCLYYQFDAHPEKLVFGRQDVSGIWFFFWDSQFGRFFNTGPIKGKGDPLFFVHTLLWAFLPWSLLLYGAVGKKLWSLVDGGMGKLVGRSLEADRGVASVWPKVKRVLIPGYKNANVLQEEAVPFDGGVVPDYPITPANVAALQKVTFPAKSGLFNSVTVPSHQEFFTLAGSGLTFLVFSASRFQLPHYLNIVFPLFAILTAWYVLGLKKLRFVRVMQWVIMGILLLVALVIHVLFQPGRTWLALIILAVGAGCWYLYRPILKDGITGILMQSALVIIFVNFWLNLVFYPGLLEYQSGSKAALYANERHPGVPVVQLADKYSYALEFYLNAPLKTKDSSQVLGPASAGYLLYAPAKFMAGKGLEPVVLFDHFHVSRLTIRLVNNWTRDEEVEQWGLWRVR